MVTSVWTRDPELASAWSDLHKDVYGVRPRFHISVDECKRDIVRLSHALGEQIESERCGHSVSGYCKYTGKECTGIECEFEHAKEEA